MSLLYSKVIKIILSVLLFVCLLDMPYGYFQLIRFISFIAFALFAYQANQISRQTEMFIFIGLAILFQPIIKISLGREVWNTVDVIVGIGLIYSATQEKRYK